MKSNEYSRVLADAIKKVESKIMECEFTYEIVEPTVGATLLKQDDKNKVQIYFGMHNVFGEPYRERKTVTIALTNKTDLDDIKHDLKNAAQEIVHTCMINKNKIDLVEAMRAWLDKREADGIIEATTISSYNNSFKYIERYFTEHPIAVVDVKASDIAKYIEWCSSSGRTNPKVNKDGTLDYRLAGRTVCGTHIVLYGFFADACRKDIISSNPCEYTKLPSKKTSEGKKQEDLWMDAEQYKLLRQWLLDNTKQYKYQHLAKVIEWFEVLMFTGARREEFCGLKWSHLKLDEGQYGVLYFISTRTKADYVEVEKDRMKTVDSIRSYPLTERLRKLFIGIKERQQSLGIYKPDNYIFVWEEDVLRQNTKAGDPYKVDYVTKTIKKAFKACPYVSNELHLHKTRHSCCSLLYSMKWEKEDVQDWLGHRDGSSITDEVYNHYEKIKLSPDISKFDKLME